MFLDELELLLHATLPLDQLADRPQAIGSVAAGQLAGLFDGGGGIAVGQTEQPHQHPYPFDAADVQHLFGPPAGLIADQMGLTQQTRGSALDAGTFAMVNVLGLRAEAARLVFDVDGDLLEAGVEQANHPASASSRRSPA